MEIIVEPSKHFRDEICNAIATAAPSDLIVVRSGLAAVLARAIATNLRRTVRIEVREAPTEEAWFAGPT